MQIRKEVKFVSTVIWVEFREFIYNIPIFIDKMVRGGQNIFDEVSQFVGTMRKEISDLFRDLRW